MSFGPVQSFIVQARRTSDLWAGSHLLSNLVWEGLKVVCDKVGRLRYSFFSPGLIPGRLSHGSALLFDWQGNLCVADERNGRVEIVGR
jgi:hypothetical protein